MIQLTDRGNQHVSPDHTAARLAAACLDAAGLCVALLREGRVLAVSAALSSMLDRPVAELEGQPWQTLIPESRHLTFQRVYQLLAAQTGQSLTYEILVTTADGGRAVCEIIQRSIGLADGPCQLLLFMPPRRDRPLESAEFMAPICSRCGNIRDEHPESRWYGKWVAFLDYVSTYELGRVTHSICPDCAVFLLTKDS
jgi:PAS domain-containing protein